MPTVKVAQHNVKSHVLRSFKEIMISRKSKLLSASRGAFFGSLAWMKAFSFSVSHFACGGTGVLSVSLAPPSTAYSLEEGKTELCRIS